MQNTNHTLKQLDLFTVQSDAEQRKETENRLRHDADETREPEGGAIRSLKPALPAPIQPDPILSLSGVGKGIFGDPDKYVKGLRDDWTPPKSFVFVGTGTDVDEKFDIPF